MGRGKHKTFGCKSDGFTKGKGDTHSESEYGPSDDERSSENQEEEASNDDEMTHALNTARKAWRIGKKVGCVAENEDVVVHALLEDAMKKKIANKSKQNKTKQGKKGTRKRKSKSDKRGKNDCPI